MVYWLGPKEMFETSTAVSFHNADLSLRDYSMKSVRFLDPDSVDPVAKVTMSEPLRKGYPIDPETVPKVVCWRSGNRHMPDVVNCAAASLLVSQKVRDIIEQFEPGVHQLLPVAVYRPKAIKENGEPFARYYWLVITQRIDSVDPVHTTYERSGGIRSDGSTWVGGWQLADGGGRKVVFSKAAIQERHMWIDFYAGLARLLSNALGDALLATDVSGVSLRPAEEV